MPAKFTTISVIGYEFTSEKRPFEREVWRYRKEITRLTQDNKTV
ncbi:MAG TPA: hypothetical protein VEL11_16585 [Candidatus Bathyarchaeia archaeon]|nr:hypothetical protein [Candidatus Bathyarchaeia archaeon]